MNGCVRVLSPERELPVARVGKQTGLYPSLQTDEVKTEVRTRLSCTRKRVLWAVKWADILALVGCSIILSEFFRCAWCGSVLCSVDSAAEVLNARIAKLLDACQVSGSRSSPKLWCLAVRETLVAFLYIIHSIKWNRSTQPKVSLNN